MNLKDNLPSVFIVLLLLFSYTLVYNHANNDYKPQPQKIKVQND